MAKTVQFKRGTTAQTNAYTGPVGEVTVDTDKDLPVVHDGSQAGGFAVAAKALADNTIALINRSGTTLSIISQSGGTTDQATEAIRGTLRVADAATAAAGTDDLEAITSKKLREQGRLQRFYESPQQTITSGGLLTLAHNLGVSPVAFELELVCVTAESGWTAGEKILTSVNTSSAGSSRYNAVYYNATNINIRQSSASDVFMVSNKTTGVFPATFTNANWRLVVRAWA